jgi:hypothetical protein
MATRCKWGDIVDCGNTKLSQTRPTGRQQATLAWSPRGIRAAFTWVVTSLGDPSTMSYLSPCDRLTDLDLVIPRTSQDCYSSL